MVNPQDLVFEKAIKKLGKDIKLVFLALFNVHKETGITAIIKFKRYSKSNLLSDALSYSLAKFPSLNNTEFNKLWKKFEEIFEKQVGYDILLGFQSLDIRERILFKYKKEIINEISRSINTLNYIEKKGIFLFLKVKHNLNFCYQEEIKSSIVQFNEQYNLIFGEPFTLSDNKTIYDLAIKVGLLFKSTWKTTNKVIEDHGVSYKLPHYLDKILIKEITTNYLTDIESPRFSDDLDNFMNRFKISESENLFQYIVIDYLINRRLESDDVLNNIKINGSKKLKNHPRIIYKNTINPLIIDKLSSVIIKVKNEINENFNWLKNYFLNSFEGAFISNEFKYGKEISLEMAGRQLYIYIFHWYNEETLKKIEPDSNRILIFLYHQNFKFLQNTLSNSEKVKGIIAFGENKEAFIKGSKEIFHNLFTLFPKIKENGYSLILSSNVKDQKEKEEIRKIVTKIDNKKNSRGDFVEFN